MTLADLSAFVRSSLKWFLVSLAVLFLLWLFWVWISGASKVVLRPKGEDTAFGKLAAPFFVKTYSPLQAGRFELSTSLPKESEKAAVYQVAAVTKFSDEQINKLATFFEFTNSSQKKAGDTITWGSTTSTAYLKLNTTLNHFTYKYNFSDESASLSGRISFDEKGALDKARETLKQFNILPEDISRGGYSVNFLNISDNNQTKTGSSTANAAEVFLFRKVGNLSSTGDGPIRFLFGPSFKILQLDYYYSPLDPVGSPYPIISSDQAWKNFQNGKAYTTATVEFDSLTVKKISLSYWESKLAQNYLQPIWVFTGSSSSGSREEEFTAYLPAISSSFLAP